MSLPAERRQEDPPAEAEGSQSSPGGDSDEMEEVDLSSLLDLQDERQAEASKRATRLILRFCAFLLVAGVVWYAVSPNNRRKVDGLIQNVKESRRELDPKSHPADIKSPYDRVLEQLGSRSTDIDTASRSLGVDPTTVKEDGMDAEMKDMMGGKGRTVGERERMVEGLAHAAGVELPKPAGRMVPPVRDAHGKAPATSADGPVK